MKNSDLELIAKKFPISDATRRRNQAGPVGPPATDAQPAQGLPLERVHPRKEKGGGGDVGGGECRPYQIRITVFARRPADWDGWHIKEIVDGCVVAGFLDSDDWRNCPIGTVTTCKVLTKEEERTEVEVIPL